MLKEADSFLPSALLWCVHRAPPQWTSRIWRWPGKSHTQSVRIVNTEGLSLKAKMHRSLISGGQIPIRESPTSPCWYQTKRAEDTLCHRIAACHRTEDNYTESGADKTCCASGSDKNGGTRCHISINTRNTETLHIRTAQKSELRLDIFSVHEMEFKFDWNHYAGCWNWMTGRWFTELQLEEMHYSSNTVQVLWL